jgi:photosystem II stability/assembly factor-like uncharacterized protein
VNHDESAQSPSDGVSRRNFLVRAGQLGAAISVAPLLGGGLIAQPGAPSAADLAVGVLRPTTVGGGARLVASAASGLQWRMLGPFRGGRVDAVSGVPGRPNEFYFGHVNAGVWKTIDGGRVWTPVFDGQPVASIGAIAVAPSAPDTVYVGSGESTLRDSNGYGNGVYKSVNAGKTWTHLGLDDTQHIGRVAVHPRDANTVFVAAIGHMYAPNSERGVFRTRDGGKSWQKVLFVNNDVGAVDVAIDPRDPNIVFASLWNTRRPPWFTYAPTNGPGGGLYKSTDGGSTWKKMTKGLPAEGIGRSGIAIAPSDSRRVYAVVDCLVPEAGTASPAPAAAPGALPSTTGIGRPSATPMQGGFFRSDDGGESWSRVSSDTALWGRGWYFEKLVVDPKNADVVYVPNVAVSRTTDGGKTWVALRGSPGGDDYHQAWVSPDETNTMIVASDQGAIITRNARAEDARDVTWSSWLNQPTAQIYHLSVDYRFPYWVTGAQQDSGAVAVRSRGKFASISMRDWEPIEPGGESGMTAGDPLHPGILFGGNGQRFDLETNLPMAGTTTPVMPSGEIARSDWTAPLVISRADPRAMYFAYQYLFKTTDGAKSWSLISKDLTRANPGIPASLDAAAAAQTDRNGKRGTIYAVCPSPILVPMVWAGTDDGLVHVTTNDGRTWTDVTPSAVTAWSRITGVEASHSDINTAWISVDRHQLQDFEPYVYRTRDQGKTWQRVTAGLPAGVYVHVVKEDPSRAGMLVAGTERGAFISMDDGEHWQPLQLNLPVTSVRDFEFYGNDLIVATHGRGFWVIDDISPLRQMSDAVIAQDAYLFQPVDAINIRQGGDNGTPLQKDEPQAENPSDGAYLYYYLKEKTSAPVTLDVLDAGGATVATFGTPGEAPPVGGRGSRGRPGGIPSTSPLWRASSDGFSTEAGVHRVVWTPIARGGGGRGDGGATETPLLGTFTARLTVNGKVSTRTFTVRPDPRGM